MTNQPSTALRSRGVWIGFLGSLAIAWGSCHPEFSFDPRGWASETINRFGEILEPAYLDRIFIVAGILALTWGWWHIRPTRTRPPVHAPTTLALWAAPLLLVPPVLSPDITLYADLGWLLHVGADPYQTGLATHGGPFAPMVDQLWAGSGVAYPPLTLRMAQLFDTLTGFHPYWSVVAMRIPAVLSVVAMLFFVPRIAEQVGVPKRGAVWLGVLNPLLIVHFIGAAHNDAPMVATSLAAIWLVLTWRSRWAEFLVAPLLVGLAMSFKQQGGLTVIAVAGLPVITTLATATLGKRLWLLAWRSAAVTAVAAAGFVGITALTGLGLGWTRWLDLMGLASTPAPLAMFSKLLAAIVQVEGGSSTGFLQVAGRVTTVILLLVLAWIVVRFSDRPLSALAWGSLAVAVLGQALHPWYLPWSLALLGLVPLTRRQRYAVFGLAIAFCLWNAFQTVLWHGKY